MQRELPGQFLVSAGYVGTRSTNNEVWIDLNSPAFVPPAGYNFDPRINAGFNTNLLRPYQGYAAINLAGSGLNSIYNSLQTSFQRRFAHGLALQGAYTYAKVLGETLSARNPTPQNPRNWFADYGPTDFDRRHVFSMNYVYVLPFLRDKHNFASQLLGDWELSGFLTFQSGLATTPGISTGKQGLATRPDATGVSMYWRADHHPVVQHCGLRRTGGRILRQRRSRIAPCAGLRDLGCIAVQAVPDLRTLETSAGRRVLQRPESHQLRRPLDDLRQRNLRTSDVGA